MSESELPASGKIGDKNIIEGRKDKAKTKVLFFKRWADVINPAIYVLFSVSYFLFNFLIKYE